MLCPREQAVIENIKHAPIIMHDKLFIILFHRLLAKILNISLKLTFILLCDVSANSFIIIYYIFSAQINKL